jgi:hypothetical protein
MMSASRMWMLVRLSFWRRAMVDCLLRTRPMTVFEGFEARAFMKAYWIFKSIRDCRWMEWERYSEAAGGACYDVGWHFEGRRR